MLRLVQGIPTADGRPTKADEVAVRLLVA